MQIYSITSGKGGVGKTSLVCNMATRFGQLGHRVLLIDADMGLANVDIVMGLSPQANLSDMFNGGASLESLLVDGPPNVTILPASSGVQEMTDLTDVQVQQFTDAVSQLDREFDVLLVDTGAGIGRNTMYFNAAAQNVLLVATPEPTSITDAYATIKVLSKNHGVKSIRLIVNQVPDRKAALKVYGYLTNVADRFLDVSIDYLGHVVRDSNVNQAVMKRQLIMEMAPTSPASSCITELVDDLVASAEECRPTGNMQFFWQRLLKTGS